MIITGYEVEFWERQPGASEWAVELQGFDNKAEAYEAAEDFVSEGGNAKATIYQIATWAWGDEKREELQTLHG